MFLFTCLKLRTHSRNYRFAKGVESISPIQRPHYITSSYTYQFLKNILDRFRIQDC